MKNSFKNDATFIALTAALLCGVLVVPSVFACIMDSRILNGINVWVKPVKFQSSFALHWLTVTWLVVYIDHGTQNSSTLLWPLRIGGFASVIEVFYITLQAARGRDSHFNFETPLETILYYGLMGGAAVIMMVATAWVGWLIWRYPKQGISKGLWLGAILGLLGGSILTLIITAPLASGVVAGPGHWVGGIRNDSGGIPIFGWSTTGGDLRVPHFFATHSIQVLPLIGLLADRIQPNKASLWVWSTVVLGLVLVIGTMVQALRGVPFFS